MNRSAEFDTSVLGLIRKYYTREFGDTSYRVALIGEERDSLALDAVHHFIEHRSPC